MYTIKRYPNRKLYDTHKNKYVNLEQIADLILQEKEILVIDNASGDDITALTLTQVILEKEKKQGNFLPRAILSTLIQSGGNSLKVFRSKFFVPAEFIRQAEMEVTKYLDKLIQKGEITQDLGKRILAHLFDNHGVISDISSISQEAIQESLKRLDLPSKQDLHNLIDQVEQISKKLDR
jgi:polyhydroxyalkanoate synthesis repressor PhaR